jgi:uncharacterized protein (TIGR02246 family)
VQASLPLPIEAIFERYVAAWAACDADRIVDLHAEDSTFWMHHGSARLEGREAIRQHFASIFVQYPKFDFEVYRTLFGEKHWVLDWAMLAVLTAPDGTPVQVRIDMLDIVDINDRGEVVRKDTFMDGAQAQAAFAKLGAG